MSQQIFGWQGKRLSAAISADMFSEPSYQWNNIHQKDLNRCCQGPKLFNVIDNAENLALMCKWVLREKIWNKNLLNHTNSKTNKINKRRESGKVRNLKYKYMQKWKSLDILKTLY